MHSDAIAGKLAAGEGEGETTIGPMLCCACPRIVERRPTKSSCLPYLVAFAARRLSASHRATVALSQGTLADEPSRDVIRGLVSRTLDRVVSKMRIALGRRHLLVPQK